MTSSNIVKLEWVIALKRGRDRCALILTFSITDLSKCIHINHCTINVTPVRMHLNSHCLKASECSRRPRSTCVRYHFLTPLEEFVFTQLSAGKKETFIGTKLQIAKIDMHKSFKSGMWKMLQHLTNREQRGNCETPENNSSVSQPVSYDTKLSCRTVLMVMMMMMMGL